MSHSSVPMDIDTREKSDHLVDSCKRLGINRMAAGLRLRPVMEFFSFSTFLNTPYCCYYCYKALQ